MPLQAMINILLEQKEAHLQLLRLAEEKRQALIDNQVELLNQLVNRESKLVKSISELEEKRVFEMNRFIVGKGFRPNPSITLTDMIKLIVKAEEKDRLQTLQKELLEVVLQLKEANRLNQQLISQSLQYLNYSIDLVTGGPEDDAVYTHPARQLGGSKRPGMFDTRA